MARRRPRTARPGANSTPAAPVAAPLGRGVVAVLALMLFLAPALGVPSEEMLQDTLKSILVSFAALGAALLYFFNLRKRDATLYWHALLWLPLALMAYALGSMAWSHTYLAGVEAIRWFVFALLLWLGLNTFERDRAPVLAWGIHAGAVVASVWTALQFWLDFSFFPQGPNPASTFVNRNFFAEYVVCTLPFSAWLVARARRPGLAAALAATTGFVIVAIFMTGTRAALLATWVLVLGVLPLAAWRLRSQLPARDWTARTRALVAAVFVGTVIVLGMIPTGNTNIAQEQRGLTALERGLRRTESIGPNDPSLGVRMLMWQATLRAIEARPLTGVGAGAWESEIPLYQEQGSQLETDYYVHNEFLQLVAEYGLVGWIFLLLLLAYLVASAWRTWRLRADAEVEAPLRAAALASLLALLIVSNIGFPWRMAATGALFAVALGLLAASDVRLGLSGRGAVQRLPWRAGDAYVALGCGFACLALAVFITQRAARSESEIVRAARIAVSISASGRYNDPRWEEPKREMLALIRDGVRINPHYRKITPIVGDELARWGDWANAIWIWESVLGSRPYVVAIITNVARGYANVGQPAKAMEYLERAKRLQPRAPAVRSLEVIVLGRSGREAQALQLARQSIAEGIYDFDLTGAAFTLGVRARDYAFAQHALELRMKDWPQSRAGSYLQLGKMYAQVLKEPAKALAFFRLALDSAPPQRKADVLAQVPAELRPQLDQTSSSSR